MVMDPAEAEMMHTVTMYLQEIPMGARWPQWLNKPDLYVSTVRNGNLEMQIHRDYRYSVQYGF